MESPVTVLVGLPSVGTCEESGKSSGDSHKAKTSRGGFSVSPSTPCLNSERPESVGTELPRRRVQTNPTCADGGGLPGAVRVRQFVFIRIYSEPRSGTSKIESNTLEKAFVVDGVSCKGSTETEQRETRTVKTPTVSLSLTRRRLRFLRSNRVPDGLSRIGRLPYLTRTTTLGQIIFLSVTIRTHTVRE